MVVKSATWTKAILILFCILLLGNIVLSLRHTAKVDTVKVIELQYKIDSVDREIRVVDTIIKNNIQKYEKTHTDIINNSVSEDYVFFTEYLEWNRQRIDKSDSIEGN